MAVSIRTKLLLFSAVGLCVSGAVGLIARAGFVSLVSSLDDLQLGGQTIRNHMETDMIHDALRGDVFEALRAQSRDEHGAAIESVKEHTGTIRETFEENKLLPLSDAIRTALADVQQPLDEYVQRATRLVSIAAENRKDAEAMLPACIEAFSAMEVRLRPPPEACRCPNAPRAIAAAARRSRQAKSHCRL